MDTKKKQAERVSRFGCGGNIWYVVTRAAKRCYCIQKEGLIFPNLIVFVFYCIHLEKDMNIRHSLMHADGF